MDEVVKRREKVIIVGGGVAGLMCARELLRGGYKVTILEASERLGGRIHTIRSSLFKHPVEKGAEFIHGNLPLTLQLLNEAGIEYQAVAGDMIRVVNGEWKTQDDFAIGWDAIIRKMNEVREDITMDDFLRENFSDEKYAPLRRSVLRFAEGFDLADATRASVLALREEWMQEESGQYRVPGGFDQLTHFLVTQCLASGGVFHTSSPVTEIRWKDSEATIVAGRQMYSCDMVIVTVSLGLLQGNSISFQPSISEYVNAAGHIGFGTVVKILTEFKEPFWKEKRKNIGFLFTDEIIPTWWTQFPGTYPLLTGWAGGPQAGALLEKGEDAILEIALQSLSNVFKKSPGDLRGMLSASLVVNWIDEPFTRGAYSYSLIESANARKLFEMPVANTIYFAGEAFYDGSSPGTVEAALVSARNVAAKLVPMEKHAIP